MAPVLGPHVAELRAALDRLPDVEAALHAAAEAVATAFRAGGSLLAAGNGGSAAEAQHLSGELVGRLHPSRERRPLPAVALHADTSALTAVANDYGYEQVFSRQVEAVGRPGDVLVVLSTSGSSANLVRAVESAREKGMVTVGLLGGREADLHRACDHAVAVPSTSIAAIQECHLVLVHVLVEMVEDALARMEA